MPAEYKGLSAKDLSMGFRHWDTDEERRTNRKIVVATFEDEEGEFLAVPFFAKKGGVSEWLLQFPEGEDQDVVLDELVEEYEKNGDYPVSPLFGSEKTVERIIARGHRRGYVYFELDKIRSLPFSDGMAWIADPVATKKKAKAKSAPTISRGGKTPAKKEAPKKEAPEKKEAATPPPLFVVTSNSTFTPEPPVKEEPVKEAPKKEPAKQPSVVEGAIFDSLAKAQIVALIKSKQPDFDWVSDKLPKSTLLGILQQFC